MLFTEIWRILGRFSFALAVALVVPFFLSGYYQFMADPSLHPQEHSTGSFFFTILLALGLGKFFEWAGREATGQLYLRESLISVIAVWLLAAFIGGMPFFLSGTLRPLQAFFEATSGWTTTGATTLEAKRYDEGGQEVPIVETMEGVIPVTYRYYGTVPPIVNAEGRVVASGIEAVGKGLLFWRSMMQWMGGIGIIVVFVAVLPMLGVGGKVMLHAEMPGPIKDSLTPRIKETASHIWKIYLGLTLAQIVLLLRVNPAMTLYDAVTTTFSTLSTGGFSPKNFSIASFDSVATEWVVIVFMVLASLNFSLYFHLIRGRIYRLYQPELVVYLSLLLIGTLYIAWQLLGTPIRTLAGTVPGTYDAVGALRQGAFQLISAQSSTGFATADYNMWPYPIQVIMLISMFVGGMSGSTAGGMKVIRPIILFRTIKTKVESLFRPQAMRKITVGATEIGAGLAMTVLGFFLTLIFFAALGTLFFTLDGLDPESALAVTTCMLNNIGIGFRANAPTATCAFLSNFGLIWSCFLMLLGRLEFYAILVVLVPAFWREQV